MSARIRRLTIIVVLAAAAFSGASLAQAATSQETFARSGLLACSLVAEARKFGLDPYAVIPTDAFICARFRQSLRYR
jgi:hypothetical protein